MNKFAFALAAAGSLALAAPATAVTLSNVVGGSFTKYYNGVTDGGTVTGLTATITFTLNSLSDGGKTWNMSALIDNTSTSPVTNSRISVFGFNTDPNLVGADTPDGSVFDKTVLGGSLPATPVEFCATAGPNCSGGSGDGIGILDAPYLQAFSLTFGSAQTSVTFENFLVRWQSLNYTNAAGSVITGDSGIGYGSDDGGGFGGAVPEPSSWAMLIAGFGLVGAVSRRRKNARLTVTA